MNDMVTREQSSLPQSANPSPMLMLSTALEKGATPETLEKLMALHERHEANQARKAFVAAMAAFKAEGIIVYKDKRVGFNSKKSPGTRTDYAHATLANICDVVGSALARHGLSYHWTTQQSQGSITVTCTLTHELGHSESTSLTGPYDQSGNKNAIQAIGSSTSYLERYTLMAITGTATAEMDDDGATGADQPRQSTAPVVTVGEASAILKELEAGGISEADFCAAFEINSVSELEKSRFKTALQWARSSSNPGCYPQDRFDTNFPEWKKLIASGTRTPDEIIKVAQKKAPLTEQQIHKIKGAAA